MLVTNPPLMGGTMLTKARTTALALALAASATVPAAALAKHGADDPPGDDHGQHVEPGDDHGGRGDDNGRHGGNGDVRGVRVAGTCDGSSTSKLKVKPDDGRLELEFEVDQNRSGVVWTVRVRRDGVLVVRRNAATHPPSGSFEIEKKIADPAGPNRIVARAESPSGEVCTAALTI
jgi:catechol 2,3-dioxygenase-like lactoylglutathione lyase family enzyme